MAVVGRLNDDGTLQLAGEVDTTTPTNTDGLIYNFPMQNSVRDVSDKNLIDPTSWARYTSTYEGFSPNGDANTIAHGGIPFSNYGALWWSVGNDAASDADGGWNGSTFPVDSSKLYRFSVWVNRQVLGDGRFYLGTHGYGTTAGVTSNDVAGFTANLNPYFDNGVWDLTVAKWYLVVGHVHSHDNTVYGDHADSGWYEENSTSMIQALRGSDFRWHSSTTTSNHRSYLYYSTLAATDQRWVYPRVDLCDGTEPTLAELVNETPALINPTTHTVTTSEVGTAVEESNINYLSDGVGGANAREAVWWFGATLTEEYRSSIDATVLTYVTAGTSYTYTNDAVLDDNLATLSDDVVTFSLMLRRIEGPATAQIRIYDNISGYTYQQLAVTSDFQKFTITKTIATSPTRVFCMLDNTGGGTYQFYNCQLETHAFATEYFLGTRGGGDLKYDVTLPSECTIEFDFYCKERISNTVVSNSQYNFWWGLYLNASGYLYTHEANAGTAHTSTYLMPLLTWVKLAISWDATTQYYHADGVLLGTLPTVGSVNSANIPILGIGFGWNVGNALFKNLRVYNRLLPDTELLQNITGNKSRILTSGIQSPKGISVGAKHPADSELCLLAIDGQNDNMVPHDDLADYSNNTAYANGVNLTYNLNASIGLDWSGDWSICYMKKPIGTHLGEADLTGYSIESLGCNSNSVGGGYMWYGKTQVANEIKVRIEATYAPVSNETFIPDDFFNKWQYVTMVKNGTTITNTFWVSDKVSRTSTFTFDVPTSNYYVTQYGYDLNLSGWDDIYNCFSHFRNLVVVKRAMTEQELTDYRLTKMSMTEDTLLVQSEIETNVTF